MNQVRADRDDGKVETLLAAVSAAAEAGDNVMPSIMDAVEAYATVGEVRRALEKVYGTYQEPVRF